MDIIYAAAPPNASAPSNKPNPLANYHTTPSCNKIPCLQALASYFDTKKQLWVYRMIDGIFESRMIEWDPSAPASKTY